VGDGELSTAQLTRPVLRYHGGKWRLAPWVISHFPEHRVYVEPFGGAASVLMRKPRCYAEVYNDLDGEIVNVFRLMRDPETADRLRELITLTPYAREEFLAAYEACEEPLERARRTIAKSFMGFTSASIHDEYPAGMRTRASVWKAPTGFRSNSNRSGTTPAHDWSHYPDQIAQFCQRLRGVVIENRSAIEVIKTHDTHDCLHYVDPPYPMETRDKGSDYRFELTDEQHRELGEVLRSVKGMVILSSYPSEMYAELYGDWRCIQRKALADGAKPRTECLWLNPAAAKLQKSQTAIFQETL
jgi:DNA adenine methylase